MVHLHDIGQFCALFCLPSGLSVQHARHCHPDRDTIPGSGVGIVGELITLLHIDSRRAIVIARPFG